MQRLNENADTFPRTPLIEHVASQAPPEAPRAPEVPITQETELQTCEEAQLLQLVARADKLLRQLEEESKPQSAPPGPALNIVGQSERPGFRSIPPALTKRPPQKPSWSPD